MPVEKISELDSIDAVSAVDLIPVVDDPSGVPATKKATALQFRTYILSTLATVASSGDYDDLTGKPTLGTAAATNATAYATAAQGTLADSATQPGDDVSDLVNDAGYLTEVGISDINVSGTANSSTYLRGDGTWATPAGGGGGDLLAANNLSDLDNAGTARENLGLEIGADVQAYDADLAAIAALSATDGNFIVGNGTTWVIESGATARASLGLGTAAVEAATAFATAAQGTLADSATQPGDNVSDLTNDAGYLTEVVIGDINVSGTANSSTYLRGDGTWATPAGGGGGDMLAANNLSEVDPSAARGNLELGTAALANTGDFVQPGDALPVEDLDTSTATQAEKTTLTSGLRITPRRAHGRGTVHVHVGDSNTDDVAGRPGWNTAVLNEWMSEGGWLAGSTYVNLGQNGSQIQGWVASIGSGSSSTPTNTRGSLWAAVNNEPDLIYFRLGTNELFSAARRAVEGQPATMQANLDTCVNFLLENSNADIMLVLPAPFPFVVTNPKFGDFTDANHAAAISDQLRQHYLAWVGKNPRVTVIDTHKDLYGLRIDNATITGVGNPGADPITGGLLMYDDLHDDNLGYRRLAQLISQKCGGQPATIKMPTIPDEVQLARWSASVYVFQHEVSGTLLSTYLDPMSIMDGRWGASNTSSGTTSEAKRQAQRLLSVDFLGKAYEISRAGGLTGTLKAYCHSSGRIITMTTAGFSQLVTVAGQYYIKLSCTGMSSPFENGDIGMVTFYTDYQYHGPTLGRIPETIVIPLGKDTEDAVVGNQVAFRFRQFPFNLTNVKVDCVTAPTGSPIVIAGSKNGSTISPSGASIADGSNTASMPLITPTTVFAIDDILKFSISSVGSTTPGAGVKVYVEGYRTQA